MIETILAVIGGLIAAGLALFASFKVKAKADAKSEQADVKVAMSEKTAEVETKTIEKANNVQNETSQMDSDTIADRLCDKYTRD